jgi:hypothetical protein
MDDPDEAERTAGQKEWATWAEHGYAKPYQPRSMLRFGTVFFLLFGVGLVVLFWLAANGRLP